MSFDMFIFDEPYYQHLNPNMISQEFSSNFFTDPLSDSSIDTLLQEISSDEPIQNPNNNNNNNNNNNDSISTPLNHSQISPNEAQSLDQIAQTLLSNSPPSHLLETLSLSQPQQTQTHFTDLSNSCDLPSGLCDYSVSDVVKTEDFHLGFDSSTYNHSYFINGGGYNNTFANEECFAKYMQRSYSSNSVDGKPSYPFQPRFDTLLNTQSIVGIGSSEVDSGYPSSQIRRVCSTGDLPVNSPEVGMNQMTQQMVCTTTSGGYVGEGNVIEDSNFKVGRYSAEERKERIDRYRAKRTQRNFNKTIKYACRKTLADNRPRIRGRFARNDEPGDIPKPNTGDDDDLWVDNLQEEEEEGIIVGGGRGGRLVSNFGGIHFQYYGY